MKPTEILSSEHRVIEVAIDCLEKIAENAQQAGKLDREDAEQVVDFIRTFADQCHHGKEEEQLFKALRDKGMPAESGPVGQMLREHEQGREFVAGMAHNLPGAADGDTGAIEKFVGHAQGYAQLLRAHIKKEDGVLFPLADRILSEADQEKLLVAFDKVETDHMGEDTHQNYLHLIESLADRLGVPRVGLSGHSCGCGH